MSFLVLDPRGESDRGGFALPPALRQTRGTVVALLDNGKIGSARFLDLIEEILRADHGVAHFIRACKPDASRSVPAGMLAELATADALVTATGDCGSCSSCTVHDAIEAERAGVPSAAIITDRFKRTAQSIAEVNGVPGYGVAVVDHPIANADEQGLRARAVIAVQQILALWTER